LAIVLIANAVVGYIGTNYLLDNLKEGPYADLFTTALCLRVALWPVISMASLVWYYSVLTELKRATLTAHRLIESR
jgi:hypothetical protein